MPEVTFKENLLNLPHSSETVHQNPIHIQAVFQKDRKERKIVGKVSSKPTRFIGKTNISTLALVEN
jgi:hypothetical protein